MEVVQTVGSLWSATPRLYPAPLRGLDVKVCWPNPFLSQASPLLLMRPTPASMFASTPNPLLALHGGPFGRPNLTMLLVVKIKVYHLKKKRVSVPQVSLQDLPKFGFDRFQSHLSTRLIICPPPTMDGFRSTAYTIFRASSPLGKIPLIL